MTTVLRQPRWEDRPDYAGGVMTAVGRPRRRGRSRFFADPAWPIVALLAAWPLWWVLGIGDYVVVLLAIPMIRLMARWRASGRPIRLPPGFALWGLFLIVTLVSVFALSLAAPQTIPSPVSHRLISWLIRTLDYGGVTVLLLYAGNLTESELPRKRLAWLLGLVGIYATVGGLLGVIAPSVHFTAILGFVVPQSLQLSNGQLFTMLHPGFSEVQNFLGYAEGRPMAPFDYTDMWGNCLASLLPWLVVAWWSYGTRRERIGVIAVLALAFVPTVYSLDRGLWVGLGCTLIYLVVRYAMRGRMAILLAVCGVVAVAGIAIAASPLQSLIAQRLAHGQSNTGRLTLSIIASKDALGSPLLGYGDTRHEEGSAQSIAVGKTANCQNCGNATIGGNGQLWLLLIASGYLGAGLYVSFFCYGAWRYRRDRTPYGIVGVLVLLLSLVFMTVYTAVGPVLDFVILSYALLWKNDTELKQQARALRERDGGNQAQTATGLPSITTGR